MDWKRVEDELPKPYVTVVVMGHECACLYQCAFHNGEHWCDSEDADILNGVPTHYLEIPRSPEAE